MKRKVFSVVSLIFLAIVSSLLFIGCDDNKKMALPTPSLSISNENNELYAVATNVENATGYYFEVNSRPFYSKNNQLNLKDIFIEYKIYAIRAYAVGGDNYNNSAYSNECIYNNQEQYATPVLNIVNNSYLAWTNIGEVTYQIKVNNSTNLIETTENEISLNNEDLYSQLNLSGENVFKVKVKKSNQILASEYSNEVSCAFISVLDIPNNVSIQENNNKTVVNWNGSADSYAIYLNGTQISVCDTNSFDISSFVLDLKEYTVNVRAISSSSLIASSELSESVTIKKYSKLSTPIINAFFDGEKIIISWDNNSLVKSYTLSINNQEIEVFTNSYIINNERLLSSDEEEYKIKVKANAFDNYYESEESETKTISNLFSTLQLPNQINITYLNDNPYLSFLPVSDAISYKLKIEYIEIREKVSTENEETPSEDENTEQNLDITEDENTQQAEETQNEDENLNVSEDENNQQNNELTEGEPIKEFEEVLCIDEIDVTSCFINLLDYISKPNLYKISIKAIGAGFVLDSEYSSEIDYRHKIKINTVENISYEIIDSALIINWDEVENADSYNLRISFDKFTYIKNNIEETNFVYLLTKSGKYNISIQANTQLENYLSSDFSESTQVNYTIKLLSPSNFNYSKKDSYLILNWLPSKYAKTYLLRCEKLNLEVEVVETDYTIILSRFNPEEEYIFYLSSLGNDENIIDSPEVMLLYTHGESENRGELYLEGDKEHDFYIETFSELVSLVKYAYEYKKVSVNAAINFNYQKDLSDTNFYPEYIDRFTDYSKKDDTIKNEIISAIIKNNLADKMQFNSATRVLTNFIFSFEYFNYEVTKSYAGDLNYQINSKFIGYNCGSCEELECEQRDEILQANSVNTTEQLLNIVKKGYKPVFEQSAKGNTIAGYYESAIEILKSICGLDADEYKIALSVYDYLCSNIVYDFSLQEYLKEVNNIDYNLYYSSNIDGVFKNKKATSVGFAKVYSLMLNMMGLDANEVITEYDGNIIGYVILTLNDNLYVVDFYNSIFISNKIDDKNMQYYSHYYFLDNTQILGYILNASIYQIENYFENFRKNTNNVNLVLTSSSASSIISYCVQNNISAIELQCNIPREVLVMLFSNSNLDDKYNHSEFYPDNDISTLFLQIEEK